MKMKFVLLWIALVATSVGSLIAYRSVAAEKSHEAQDGHDHAGEHSHGGEEEHGDNTEISDASAQAMAITVLEAGPALIHQTVSLTGKIILNQDASAQILARFPGVIKSARKSVGDVVKKGEVLATIESNTSLQTYSVTSPLNGVVIARNASVGGAAGEEPVYIVADLSRLWAEFFVFSRDMDRIRTGQKVDVTSLNDNANSAEAEITSLMPVAETSSQTVVARAVIDNADHLWRAGMTVRGDVVLNEKEVPLAVKTSAIQRQEGSMVIYVKEGQSYEMRKVELGQADREWTEILSGIEPGESYVATNSFVVKADIGKSTAEHEH